MRNNLLIDFLWIPPDLGGHTGPPYSGMRLEIRWQRYLAAFLSGAWDVECLILTFDATSSRGRAQCMFSPRWDIPAEWLEPDQLIELLNGPNVLAVGRIVSP